MSPSPPPPLPPGATRDARGDVQRLLAIVRGLARELRPHAPEVERLDLDHSLDRDFGLDSLARTELLARIDREFGVRLSADALGNAETPRDLLRLAGGDLSAAAARAGATPELAGEELAAQSGRTEADRPPDSVATLIALLDWHVATHGEQTHITLYRDDGSTESLSYRALQDQARTVAAGLLSQGLVAGDKVAVMLPTGPDFFAAFYGVLYAGCVPVPLYPPARPSQIEDHMRRIAGIVANAQAVILVTVAQAKPLGQLLRAQCEWLRKVLTVADLRVAGAPPAAARPAGPADVAFLQYTSGSTGSPKGVVLTHANLLANLRAMERASGVTSADSFVSWLPLYHDMGLIGACMGSLAVGFPLVLMSPLTFLARPAIWLWTIHRHRATVSAAPNFAYELCANKIDDRDLAGLDLSCWRLAYNGAEPVSPDTIERFAARFARYGFNRLAMTPVYGLAESSVGLAFPPLGRGPLVDRIDRDALARLGISRPAPANDLKALRLVSSGLPLPGHQIRITDAGRELPERAQGHVQFCGPSATAGYYRNPEATSRLFDGPWLDSGDMGYIAAGELYLTGRAKDLIIRAGHHLFPQELEEAISGVGGVRKGGVAVFAATDARVGTERLVVLAETREENATERRRILAEINNLAVDLLGMPVDDIVLAPPRTVLKTSSGKLRRAACREMYERGQIGSTQRAPWLQMVRLGLAGGMAQLRRLVRQGAAWLWSAWAWTVFVILAPVAWLLIVLLPGRRLRRHLARGLTRAGFVLTGLTPGVEGLHHLAGGEHVIVVANHASYVDVYLLTAVLPPRFAYVAKQELLLNPALAIVLRRLGCIFVERFDMARGVEETRELEQLAHAGQSLVLFPEGTFRRDPGLMSFRLGAFQAAARSGTPVVPITLVGTRSLLRDGQWQPRRGELKVLIGAPLAAAGSDWQAALRLRDAARSAILANVGEPDAAA